MEVHFPGVDAYFRQAIIGSCRRSIEELMYERGSAGRPVPVKEAVVASQKRKCRNYNHETGALDHTGESVREKRVRHQCREFIDKDSADIEAKRCVTGEVAHHQPQVFSQVSRYGQQS